MSEAVIGEQTQEMIDKMWDIVYRDFKADYESGEVFEKLNDNEFIRPFSERLLAFYNEILNSSFTAEEATKDLQRRVKQKEIPLNRNNIANWFSGITEPKYGDKDRKNLFAVAFALELDPGQTEKLFHKVFLDKAFNKRNINEFIYLHCIVNKKPLSVAEALISKLDSISADNMPNDQTELTQFLADAASKDMSESEFLKFIASHQHNFSLNNTAAKKHRQVLLDRLTIGSGGGSGLASQEFERRRYELQDNKDTFSFDGKDSKSVDFLLFLITDVDFVRKGNKDIQSMRYKLPRKEISNQFPDKQSLSTKDPSSYALRKDIILLYFYDYWVSDFLDGKNAGDYDGFTTGLNDVLFDCGFSPLYVGNPYDWLFLYCSACADQDYTPLDRFRGLLAQEQHN